MPYSYLVQMALLFGFYILEHYFPFYSAQGNRDRHASIHMAMYAINLSVFYVLFAVFPILAPDWAEQHPVGLLYQLALPVWLGIPLALLLLDLWGYVVHRASHAIPLLWRFHRVHHSDSQLDVTTTFRHHAGEQCIGIVIDAAFIIVMGITPAQYGIYLLCTMPVIMFQHSNIALPEKWDKIMRAIIVSPGMHRVHHSPLRVETDSNFSDLFSFWDRIGGTYKVRKDANQYGLNEFREPQWQTLAGIIKTPLATV